MEQCEGSFVADAPTECGFRPTSAAQVGPSAGVRCYLPSNRPLFLGNCGELNHTDFSLLLNKKDGLQFDLLLRSDGARHIRNSVRELSDQASFFAN
jgi:hypothetical protein